jgi:hypothetical protein
MKVILNENDMNSLSKSALNEIYSLIGKQNFDSNNLSETQDDEDRPYDMTAHMAKKFMSGVSEKTKDFLKVFADNEGIGKVDDLLNATDSKILRDLNGIQAGLTRRIRKLDIDDNSAVYLLGWEDDESDEDWEGYYFISEITTQSLKRYFDK